MKPLRLGILKRKPTVLTLIDEVKDNEPDHQRADPIEEQLGQEQILIQKFKMYAGMTQDQQLKACCEQIASKHEIHKNKLLNLLA